MSKHTSEPSSPQDGASMDQVRELLFGTQMKDMENKLQRQEEKLRQEMADSGEVLKDRLDLLEKFMKSEIESVLTRVNAEKAERESALKDARRDLDESAKAEQRDRLESLKAEQRERGEALVQLGKDLAALEQVFERRLSALSSTLDSTERGLRELLLEESSSMAAKVEDRYHQALEQLKKTSEQIRHDMVHRSALSGLFTETALKLSGQWEDSAAAPVGASPHVNSEGGPDA